MQTDSVPTPSSFTAFAGHELLASGSVESVLRAVKNRLDAGETEPILIFEDDTGNQVDFDFRGTADEVVGRLAVHPLFAAGAASAARTGPGRPRLGVVSREVSLLPRQWEWLEQKPGGISAALRKQVDESRRREPDAGKARTRREAAGKFMWAMAGNLPGFEEAGRALYAADLERFRTKIREWPADVRDHLLRLLPPAEARSRKEITAAFVRAVWNEGDLDAADQYVAPRYHVRHDPGDPWDGKELDLQAFKERARASRAPFPDQRFEIRELFADGEAVVMTWLWTGTHRGDLEGFPATGKEIRTSGITVYFFEGDRIRGHWQVKDALGVFRQLRRTRALTKDTPPA